MVTQETRQGSREETKPFDIQVILEIERQRKKVLYFRIACVVAALVGVATVVFIVGAVILIADFFFYIFGVKRVARNYAAFYKDYFIRAALESVFTELDYQPTNSIPERTIRSAEIIERKSNEFSGADYIVGKYKGVDMQFSDVYIKRRKVRNKKEDVVTDIFKGKWMMFRFNKDFNVKLQLRGQDSFEYSEILLDQWQEIEMEDMQFNKEFEIQTTDPHETYYILTPHMMERIKRVSAANKGKTSMCFMHGWLYVLVKSSKKTFEVPFYKKIDAEFVDKKLYNNIHTITNVIDELQIDKNIFKN